MDLGIYVEEDGSGISRAREAVGVALKRTERETEAWLVGVGPDEGGEDWDAEASPLDARLECLSEAWETDAEEGDDVPMLPVILGAVEEMTAREKEALALPWQGEAALAARGVPAAVQRALEALLARVQIDNDPEAAAAHIFCEEQRGVLARPGELAKQLERAAGARCLPALMLRN
eukprot:973207-Prymnesium_polylepis.1